MSIVAITNTPPKPFTPMVRINGKDVLFSDTFTVRDDSLVEFDAIVNQSRLRCELQMTVADGDRAANWEVKDNVLKFTLRGWREVTGVAMKDPQRVGNVGKTDLFFTAVAYRIGDVNLVHFCLLGTTAQ